MPKKYDDFAEGAPVERRGKLPPYAPVKYVEITCPHCRATFTEINESLLLSKKSTVCLQHLRTCQVFSANGGSVSQKKASSTEFEKLKAIVERQGVTIRDQGVTIERLQDKTVLYDSVLTAVLPSLTLPLTAPIERAQLALREAAMRDLLQPQPITLLPPSDAIPLIVHTQMIHDKNTTIEEKKATIEQKDRMLEWFEQQVKTKEAELALAIQAKCEAERKANEATVEKREAERKESEAEREKTTLATRVDRLDRERRALKAKVDELTGKTHAKMNPNQLLISSLEQVHRLSHKRPRD